MKSLSNLLSRIPRNHAPSDDEEDRCNDGSSPSNANSPSMGDSSSLLPKVLQLLKLQWPHHIEATEMIDVTDICPTSSGRSLSTPSEHYPWPSSPPSTASTYRVPHNGSENKPRLRKALSAPSLRFPLSKLKTKIKDTADALTPLGPLDSSTTMHTSWTDQHNITPACPPPPSTPTDQCDTDSPLTPPPTPPIGQDAFRSTNTLDWLDSSLPTPPSTPTRDQSENPLFVTPSPSSSTVNDLPPPPPSSPARSLFRNNLLITSPNAHLQYQNGDSGDGCIRLWEKKPPVEQRYYTWIDGASDDHEGHMTNHYQVGYRYFSGPRRPLRPKIDNCMTPSNVMGA